MTFRKTLYETIEQLQSDLDQWLNHYNTERTHQGKMCCGRTPFDTMMDGKHSGAGFEPIEQAACLHCHGTGYEPDNA